jgi:riboflavin biosynthesis pyrimidine reductase
MSFKGPGSSFELLLETNNTPGMGLPRELKEIYGGDWIVPDTSAKPYSYSNFVMSHDGRVSFNLPGHEGGGDVSGFNRHDQWLMALARARADAVVVGANTLRTESEHEWTAGFIFPQDEQAFRSFRSAENRKELPLQVIVTRSGDVKADAEIFQNGKHKILVATSEIGSRHLSGTSLPNTEVIVFGEAEVDLENLYGFLHKEYGCQTILCEGGPKLYGSLVAANQLDEEFLTYSPVLIGGGVSNPRPGLLEGISFDPAGSKLANLQSVRRSGNHLFIRTSWR